MRGARPRSQLPATRGPEWQFLWYERADSTTMAPWVALATGLLAMLMWILS